MARKTKTNRTQYTPEEKAAYAQERAAETASRISHGVQECRKDAGFRRFMRLAGRNPYSFSNLVLIMSQRPDATQVAGYKTWQGLGRQVRKGEKGIIIYKPLRTKNEDNSEGISGFRATSVFDISQTDGEELVSPYVALSGDDMGIWAHVTSKLEKIGCTLEFMIPLDSTRGTYHRASRQIKVVQDTPAEMARVLLHEICHHYMYEISVHQGATKDGREVIADTAACIACEAFNLKIDDAVIGYVATYAHGMDDVTFKKAMQDAQRVAQAVLRDFGPDTPAGASEDAETLAETA